jgi:hypothetical protein
MTFSRKDNPWDMEITCLAILWGLDISFYNVFILFFA